MSACGCCRALELGVALYHQGALLLSEAPQEGRSRLLITARDMTLPPLGLAVSSSRADGLREAVGQLEMLVPGVPLRLDTSSRILRLIIFTIRAALLDSTSVIAQSSNQTCQCKDTGRF